MCVCVHMYVCWSGMRVKESLEFWDMIFNPSQQAYKKESSSLELWNFFLALIQLSCLILISELTKTNT
jgi:hypothetical protein